MKKFKKQLSTFNFQLSSSKGFSLVEFLVYMGVFSILLVVLSSLFATVIDAQLESKSTSSVDQDGRYIMAKLMHDFQANDPVIIKTPAASGGSATSLAINLNNAPVDTTYSLDANNNLLLTDNGGASQLNTADTTISNLNVTRLGAGDNATVRVSFTVTSTTRRKNGVETKTYQSAFSGHRGN